MRNYLSFCLFILVGSIESAETINVHGIVLNNVGVPIPNAIVELVHLGLKDTTGADGLYSFPNRTVVKSPSILPATAQLSLNKGILELTLTHSSPVKIEIFNAKGTLLKNESLQDATPGLYRFTIDKKCRATNLLFIHASIGGREITFPYLRLNNGKYTVETSFEKASPFTHGPAKKQADSVTDTLKVTAPGYMTNAIAVTFERYDNEVNVILNKTDTRLVKSDIPQSTPHITGSQINSLVESNTLFAFDLYNNLKTSDDNIFFSPYSISEAIAMVYGGAESETAVQIANTLRFTLPDSLVHAGFDSLDRSLTRWTTQECAYTLNNANSVWMQEGFPIKISYLDLLAAHYNTGFYAVDFTKDPDSSRVAINSWMSDMTAGRINDCLPQGALSTLTRLVLVNSLYFKSMWNDTFSVADTRDSTFFNLDSTTSTVPFMHAKMFEVYYYETDRYQAAELMLAGMRTSMIIVLPKPGYFNTVESEFTMDTLSGIISNFDNSAVIVSMPKFSFGTELYHLNSILSSLGMPDAFSLGTADFSGIDGTRDLFIESVYHKGFLDVNERGVEAAAVSVIAVSAGIVEDKIMTVDHPFMLFIRHRWTKTVLFMGRVIKL